MQTERRLCRPDGQQSRHSTRYRRRAPRRSAMGRALTRRAPSMRSFARRGRDARRPTATSTRSTAACTRSATPTHHSKAASYAAVKACGPGAVLSHHAAAALHGLIPWDHRYPEVTVRGQNTRRHRGIRVHRTASLDREDTSHHRGIPITTPARTLADLAATLEPQHSATAASSPTSAGPSSARDRGGRRGVARQPDRPRGRRRAPGAAGGPRRASPARHVGAGGLAARRDAVAGSALAGAPT